MLVTMDAFAGRGRVFQSFDWEALSLFSRRVRRRRGCAVRSLRSLRQRWCEPEIMDRPDLDARRHEQALRGLARLNRVSGSARLLWPPLRELLRRHGGSNPIRLLDVATGSGDVPIALWKMARSAGFDVCVAGCDRSARALELARQRAAAAGAEARFFEADVLRDSWPVDYDVIICSTFLHHLDEDDAVLLLHRMAAARQLVLVNDLRRSAAAWLVARAGTQLLTRSPVVHVDGPRSVQAAFTIGEAKRLAERAGLSGARVEPRWPWRFLLTWWNPQS